MSDVVMPQLGETVTEGTITKWFKKVGDTVERDELLFEVSTDKVDSEVTAPASGVIVEIRVPEGETVDVGSVLAVIGEAGAAPVAAVPPPPPPPAAAAPPPPPPPPPPAAAAPPPPPPPQVPPAVVPEPPAAVVATPPSPAPAAPVAGASIVTDKVLSPVVRKLINENGLDPATIVGTGVGGRITREDVLDVLDARRGTSAPAAPAIPGAPPAIPAPVAPPAIPAAPADQLPSPSPALTPMAAVPARVTPAMPAVQAGPRDQVVPFSNIRRRTGEHMLMSIATSPHAFIAVEVDFNQVDRFRGKVKEAFKADEGFSLTYLPFIARAVVDAVRSFPHVNASVSGDTLVVHQAVNLGIAVDLDFNGLLVPVVRDADGKRMRAVARDIADIASRARSKKLSADDLVGGTFTISNAGPYGIDLMSSIINQPQVAIMSTTAVKKRPVVVELPDGSDTIAIHPMGWIGFSWDHRAFDGAYAASFLAKVAEILETRDWSAEL